MAVKIWDSSTSAFKDADNPKVYSGGAWVGTDGKSYENGVWKEDWKEDWKKSYVAWDKNAGVTRTLTRYPNISLTSPYSYNSTRTASNINGEIVYSTVNGTEYNHTPYIIGSDVINFSNYRKVKIEATKDTNGDSYFTFLLLLLVKSPTDAIDNTLVSNASRNITLIHRDDVGNISKEIDISSLTGNYNVVINLDTYSAAGVSEIKVSKLIFY